MFGKGSFSWYNLIFWYILLIEMTYCGFYFKANTYLLPILQDT